jgi:hypothetical protein
MTMIVPQSQQTLSSFLPFFLSSSADSDKCRW